MLQYPEQGLHHLLGPGQEGLSGEPIPMTAPHTIMTKFQYVPGIFCAWGRAEFGVGFGGVSLLPFITLHTECQGWKLEWVRLGHCERGAAQWPSLVWLWGLVNPPWILAQIPAICGNLNSMPWPVTHFSNLSEGKNDRIPYVWYLQGL